MDPREAPHATPTQRNAQPPARDEGYDPHWLHLREGADAQARSSGLVDMLRPHLARRTAPGATLHVHDLGCGTGSLLRWLSPRLPGPQHWTLHDHDPALLTHAANAVTRLAAAARPTLETRRGDVTALEARELAGAALVSASALLDLLTHAEVRALARTCTAVGAPALFTLSVTGNVELRPSDPLDSDIAAAFNAHQRRLEHGRRLLGPDAPHAAAESFTRLGCEVHRAPSPWRLGPRHPELLEQWLHGWLDAACAQHPALAREAEHYIGRRRAQMYEGKLDVTVNHEDLLVLPRELNQGDAGDVFVGENTPDQAPRDAETGPKPRQREAVDGGGD